jgi:hypothetical protein
MEFVQSNKGNLKVIFEGYVYVKQKDLANGVVSFECSKRRNKAECKAKIKIHGEQLVGRCNEHSHGPDPSQLEVCKVVQQMKQLAEETEATPQQIITQSITTITEDAKAKLPSIPHIRRNIRRQRQTLKHPLSDPRNVDDIIIPEQYTMTQDGQQFLLFDSGAKSKGRMFLFGTKDNLRLLEVNQHWFMDGTFKTAPALFSQLYTVHALVNGRTVPCVYALLQNKTQETYTALLQQLTVLNTNLQPISIMIDFEMAVIKSVERVFPECEVKGCFFHLSQNIYRKIQDSGLQQLYQVDSEFALKLRMLPALAFVPIEHMSYAFEKLLEIFPQEAMPIADYFEDYYIGRPQRRGRRQPMFPLDIWNMHTRAEDHMPKTNNSVEGWHRSFQSHMGCCHPNIWKFIDFIKKEQSLQEVYCTQINSGHCLPKQKKKYIDSSSRILTVVKNFNESTIIEYLRGIAHNLSF